MVILQEDMIDQGNNSSLIVYYIHITEYFFIFSPPYTKCHINYCHHLVSVILHNLDQIKPSLAEMDHGYSSFKTVSSSPALN